MVDRYVDKCLSTVIFLINLSDKSVRVEHFNRNISPLHVGCSSHVSRIYWSLLSFILFCVLCYLFFFSVLPPVETLNLFLFVQVLLNVFTILRHRVLQKEIQSGSVVKEI